MAASNVNAVEMKADDTDDIKVENITIPDPEQAILEKVTDEMKKLYEYKCKHNINEDGSVTFWPTPDLKPSQQKLPTKQLSMQTILDKENCTGALAVSTPDAKIVAEDNRYGRTGPCSFIVSSINAWSNHYPFRFRAEHVWLLILQGVAVHVDQNAEKLRDKYVSHDGKKTLVVDISGNPSRKEWMSTIENFSQQIDKNTVEDTGKLLDCNFSTATAVEKIAAKVTIMDICKNYFSYRCSTCCGFPQITLDGTKDDWVRLKQKTTKLLSTKVDKKFGAQWGAALLPLLDRFIVAFDGKVDGVFWNSMIKRGSRGGSGGYSWYTGWFNILFPFLNKRWNGFCEPYSMDKSYVAQGLNIRGRGRGENDVNDYPLGIASAPVVWDNNGTIINLKFLAGFVGYKQDPKTLEITPNVEWCVAKAMTDKEIEAKKSKSRW